MNQYEFLDSGGGKKLERFGSVRLIRPCSQAVWQPSLNEGEWKKAKAEFIRDSGWKGSLPNEWEVQLERLHFYLRPTDFGHLGIFAEHSHVWKWMRSYIDPGMNILNLFAYTGAATLVAAQEKAKVCHLDASPKSVEWAKKNAHLNRLNEAPIRWMVDDALKFLKREVKRGVKYDGVILDPPSFGRGKKQEVFKIEDHVVLLLDLVHQVLSEPAKFVIFSSHTPGFTPVVLENLLKQTLGYKKGTYLAEELLLSPQKGFSLPLGSYCRWSYE